MYFVVHDFMVKDLKLKGLARDIYAIIYGFSQNSNAGGFHGSLNYLSDATGASRESICRELKKLTESNHIIKHEQYINNIKLCTYYVNVEKINGVDNLSMGVDNLSMGVDNLSIGGVDNLSMGVDKKSTNNKDIINTLDNKDIINTKQPKKSAYGLPFLDGDVYLDDYLSSFDKNNDLLRDKIIEFISYKKKVAKYKTFHGIKRLVSDLRALHKPDDIVYVIDRIEYSMQSGWKSVYEMPDYEKTPAKQNTQDNAPRQEMAVFKVDEQYKIKLTPEQQARYGGI